MRKSRIFAGMLAALFTFAGVSCANNVSADPSDLQDLLISTDKESVDLSGESFELKDGSSVIVTKPLTITGGASQYDLKGATITVKAAGAKIENVTNVSELIVDEAVGDGDFTVSNSNIAKLTVKGGGANSIHLDGTAVAAVTIAKEGVRLVLEGSTAIAAVDLQVACVLDSTSETAVIASVTVASTVKSVTLKGKTNITAIQAASKDFKIAVASNDIKIKTTVVKTEDGKVSAITVEATSEDIKVPETKLPDDVKPTEEPVKQPGETPADPNAPTTPVDPIPTPDPDALLGPNSKGGHLSLEAVEGGIKVTVRILDGDIPAGKKLTSMDSFYIEETSTRIRLDLNKNLLLESAGDGRVNELSGIFPFTKADTDYKFEYVFDMQDNGNTFYPYTKESAACKATSTGLSLNEYFDFDYAPYTAKVMVNDNGIMSINKDVSKFIRKEDATIYIEGDVVSGVYDWSDADWCGGWESSIRNYEPGWRCRIDYKELFEKNANLGTIVLQYPNAVLTLSKRDTWFVNGNYKFSFPEIETGFLMVINSASKGEEASSEMFKALHLDNPFTGKTFTQNNNGGYITKTKINFIDDSTAIVSKNGSEPEVVAEYAYRVDFSKNKMYLETQKANIGGTLRNREEYMKMLRSEYLGITDEQLNIMLSQLFSRYEIVYSINLETNEVTFHGIMYDNPEDYLVNNVTSIPAYEYYTYGSENLSLWLGGNSFEYRLAQDYKCWIAISVNDGKITYIDSKFTGEKITIPYEFKTVDDRNVLTITYEEQSYDLLGNRKILVGTLSDN